MMEVEPPKPLGPAPFTDLDPKKIQDGRKMLDDFIASLKGEKGGSLTWPDEWEGMRDGLKAMEECVDDDGGLFPYPPELDIQTHKPPHDLHIALPGMIHVEHMQRTGGRR